MVDPCTKKLNKLKKKNLLLKKKIKLIKKKKVIKKKKIKKKKVNKKKYGITAKYGIRVKKHSAGGQNLPMIIYNSSPHKTVNEAKLHNMRMDLEKARHRIDEIREFAKLKLGKAIGVQMGVQMESGVQTDDVNIVSVADMYKILKSSKPKGNKPSSNSPRNIYKGRKIITSIPIEMIQN